MAATVGGCEKKVNTERSQALLVGTTNFSENFSEKNRQLKKEQKPKLLIFACLLLPYRVNSCAVFLFLGTAWPYRKNGTAVVRLSVHSKMD